jgi:hypothetical protein
LPLPRGKQYLDNEKIKFQSDDLENGCLVAKVKSTHMSYCIQTNTISMWTTYYAGLKIKTRVLVLKCIDEQYT